MRKIFAIAGALALAGCATTGLTVAQLSDETRASADAAYIAAVKAGQVAVTLGKLTPAAYKADAAKGYAILLQVRAGTATVDALTSALAPLNGGQ